MSTVPRIGILIPGTASNTFWEAFLQALRDLGYVEGKHLVLEYRFAAGQYERLPALAAELVRLPVDVLVTAGAGALAAKQVTATIPIVFTVFADPLAEGLVASLARPGGNVTGLSLMSQDLAAKRLELLTAVVPGLRRIAILWNPARPAFAIQIQESQTAAAQKWTPSGRPGGAQLVGVRPRLSHHGRHGRRCGHRPRRGDVLRCAHPPCYPGGAVPDPGNIRAPGVCGSWRPPVLWPELPSAVPPGCDLRRQDP